MDNVKILALGGLDEDGKNMYLVEVEDDIFVIECGLKYPDPKEQLGVESIIPDFKYLIENKHRVKGIFITHGHDDVMKALPYLLKDAVFDVYATALTAKIIEKELTAHKLKNKVKVISRNGSFNIGKHKIITFPIMQSIADGIGLAINTKYGSIVYTSEYIFDYDYLNINFAGDVNVINDIGKNGVLALLSESVGAVRSGYTSPRHKISSTVEPFFETAQGRIVVSVYKQNLYRIIEILELAYKYQRRVFVHDRDQMQILKMVNELGYYHLNSSKMISEKEFNNSDEDVLVLVGGSGNRVFKKLHKMAIGEDNLIEFRDTDTIIIASPVVPGTEKAAAKMEDDLYKAKVNIFKVKAKEVLSMHASVEDLKMMLYLLKPKYYIPVKGDYRALIENANVAVSMGYTPDKVVVLDNGQIASFENGRLKSTKDFIKLEDSLIDGNDRLDIGGMVLKDRETLSTDGAIVIGVVLNHKTKELIGGPDIQSRGVIYLKDAEYVIAEVGNILLRTIKEAVADKRYENMAVRMEAKEKITKYLLKEIGKRPMILPAIVEINIGE